MKPTICSLDGSKWCVIFESRGTLILFAMLTQRRRIDESRCPQSLTSVAIHEHAEHAQLASSPPSDSGPHIPALPNVKTTIRNDQNNATTDFSQATTSTLPTSPDNHELGPSILSVQTPPTTERNRTPGNPTVFQQTDSLPLHAPTGQPSFESPRSRKSYGTWQTC